MISLHQPSLFGGLDPSYPIATCQIDALYGNSSDETKAEIDTANALELRRAIAKCIKCALRTTSRNPIVRLLLVGLAFVIFNLYSANRERIAICLKNPAVPISKYGLTLRRIVRMMVQTDEKLFDLTDVVFRHTRFALS